METVSRQFLILDSTAGTREMWRGQTSNVIFLDRRPEVRPEIVADIRFLPFRPQIFQTVIFDPPHHHGDGGLFREKYSGFGSYDDLRILFGAANREFGRILAKHGVLYCKTTCTFRKPKHHWRTYVEHYMNLALRQLLFNFTMYYSKARPSKGGRKARVYWEFFRKK